MRTSLYTRKVLVVLTVYAVVIFILCNTYLFISRRDQIKKAASSPSYAGLSQRQQAIKRAEQYFVTNVTAIGPAERLFLTYLQRKYDLNNALGPDKYPIMLQEGSTLYPQEINYLARIAYPEKVVSIPPRNNLAGISMTNVFAASCDVLSVPSDFGPTMQAQSTAGGYQLTHTVLALIFMKDNQCNYPAGIEDIRQRSVEGLMQIAGDTSNPNADLRYEATAFLMLDGKYNSVEPGWIEQIIAKQLPDGSWGLNIDDKKQDNHATLLALWALLEYENPDKPYEPLIRHSSN